LLQRRPYPLDLGVQIGRRNLILVTLASSPATAYPFESTVQVYEAVLDVDVDHVSGAVGDDPARRAVGFATGVAAPAPVESEAGQVAGVVRRLTVTPCTASSKAIRAPDHLWLRRTSVVPGLEVPRTRSMPVTIGAC